MKKIVILISALAMLMVGCSEEDQNVEVVIPQNTLPLIPSLAKSCLAIASATADSPVVPDIQANYFRVPKITFNRKDASKELTITTIHISISIPGGQTVNCVTGGQALSTLSSDWGLDSDSIIPAGNGSFSTDCPLYCGSVSVTSNFVATGTMYVAGVERAPGSDQESPVRVSTSITIEGQTFQ